MELTLCHIRPGSTTAPPIGGFSGHARRVRNVIVIMIYHSARHLGKWIPGSQVSPSTTTTYVEPGKAWVPVGYRAAPRVPTYVRFHPPILL